LSQLSNVEIVAGGSERWESIANGLASIDRRSEVVLVHDAARPAVTGRLIASVLNRAVKAGAAVPTLQITETVKRVGNERQIIETVDRTGLHTVQTPQGFRRDILIEAYNRDVDFSTITDDASLVELLGGRVETVPGERDNIKLTWPEDFRQMERILRERGITD